MSTIMAPGNIMDKVKKSIKSLANMSQIISYYEDTIRIRPASGVAGEYELH